MKNTLQHAAPACDPPIRSNWPAGLLGWLAYVFDHRLRGYERPVDWNSLWMWEQTGHGLPVFANGGVLVLLGHEVDVFRLFANGVGDADVASSLRLTERKVAKVRREIAYRLGVSSVTDLAEIASTHGIK